MITKKISSSSCLGSQKTPRYGFKVKLRSACVSKIVYMKSMKVWPLCSLWVLCFEAVHLNDLRLKPARCPRSLFSANLGFGSIPVTTRKILAHSLPLLCLNHLVFGLPISKWLRVEQSWAVRLYEQKKLAKKRQKIAQSEKNEQETFLYTLLQKKSSMERCVSFCEECR